jgi:CHAT domain
VTFTQVLYPNATPWLWRERIILWQGCYGQGEAFADKYSAAEAEAIAPILKNVTLLTGSQATENSLKQIKSPQILHIATH